MKWDWRMKTKIRQATLEDKQGILRLLGENHVSSMEEADKKTVLLQLTSQINNLRS